MQSSCILYFKYKLEYRILQVKEKLAEAVNRYKSTHELTFEQLANEWKVCKTTLHRASSKDWKRPSRKLKEIAARVNVDLQEPIKAENCKPVLAAIQQIWDGSDMHARKLARLMIDIHDLAARQKL